MKNEGSEMARMSKKMLHRDQIHTQASRASSLSISFKNALRKEWTSPDPVTGFRPTTFISFFSAFWAELDVNARLSCEHPMCKKGTDATRSLVHSVCIILLYTQAIWPKISQRMCQIVCVHCTLYTHSLYEIVFPLHFYPYELMFDQVNQKFFKSNSKSCTVQTEKHQRRTYWYFSFFLFFLFF